MHRDMAPVSFQAATPEVGAPINQVVIRRFGETGKIGHGITGEAIPDREEPDRFRLRMGAIRNE